MNWQRRTCSASFRTTLSSMATSAQDLSLPTSFWQCTESSVEAEQAEVVALVLGVADGRIDEDGIAAFLRDHSVPIET